MNDESQNTSHTSLETIFKKKLSDHRNKDVGFFHLKLTRSGTDLVHVGINAKILADVQDIIDSNKVRKIISKRKFWECKHGPARPMEDVYHVHKFPLKDKSLEPRKIKVLRKRRKKIKILLEEPNKKKKKKKAVKSPFEIALESLKLKIAMKEEGKLQKGNDKKLNKTPQKLTSKNKTTKAKEENSTISDKNLKSTPSKKDIDVRRVKDGANTATEGMNEGNVNVDAGDERTNVDTDMKNDESGTAKNRTKKDKNKSIAERNKRNSLPEYAKFCPQLKEIRIKKEKKCPPQYHGMHILTRCYEGGKNVDECEKTPIFERFLNQAEKLNGGPLSSYVDHRAKIYDSLCQELLFLEKKQDSKKDIYKPRPDLCYNCKLNSNKAETIFITKSAQQDQVRNVVQSSGYKYI